NSRNRCPAGADDARRRETRLDRKLRAGWLHGGIARPTGAAQKCGAPQGGRQQRSLNIYETDKLLAEYLLFHYGSAGEILPYEFGPQTALDFPMRCVTECIDQSRVRQDA